MFVRPLKCIAAVFLSFAIMQVASSKDGGQKYKYPATLFETITGFAKQKRLSEVQLWDQLFELVVEPPCWVKGGVGALSDDDYILVDSERNAIQVPGERWIGLPSAQSQVVIIDGHKIFEAGAAFTGAECKVVMFSKDKVRFIDYKNKRAGCFKRFRYRFESEKNP